MNKSHIATVLALQQLKCTSLDTIGDRILLQKNIFSTRYWTSTRLWI